MVRHAPTDTVSVWHPVEIKKGSVTMNVDQLLPPATDRVLSEVQVAERLGVSLFTVRAWRHRGMGPRFLKMGRAVRYRSRDIEAFEERALVDPASVRAGA